MRKDYSEIKRRVVLVLMLTTCVPASSAFAQEAFPRAREDHRPFPSRRTTDSLVSFSWRPGCRKRWGQPVLIDFKPGAGTVIGVDAVAKATPDGQSLGMVNTSLAINPSLKKKMPYDTAKDIVGVTQLASLQLAMVARPDAPFNTVSRAVRLCQAQSRQADVCDCRGGKHAHLGAELLKKEAGFDMLHVPMKAVLRPTPN
jgi:tripartite-type tricarboxylate transporter receptor subunit TctC